MGCDSLKYAIFQEGIEEISGYRAFAFCYDLQTVVFPKSLKKIGEVTFFNSSIDCVVYEGTQAQKESISIGEKNGTSYAEWHYEGSSCTPKTSEHYGNTAGFPCIVWHDEGCNLSHEVYRADSEKGTYQLIGTTAEDTYLDTTAVVGKTYYYKAKGINVLGKVSQLGSSVRIMCKPESPVITVETDPQSGKPVISWAAVTGAKKYEIYRATENGAFKYIKTVTGLRFVDTSAQMGKAYRYNVYAIGSKSSVISDASAAGTANCVCPQPTVSVESAIATGRPVLSWKKTAGAVRYEVYRAFSADGVYELLSTQTALSFADTTAPANTTCYCRNP